ncbi:hypothetical protein K6119_15275 [Paracrocinitomix mangrovi]|uniref:hypothetical protein n=1 Tax=Paracrocinitomix mangrovi TaxID=2862509 RepID=UPI001C8D7BE9|nr:hypothetical protein [Paracrocinitomix mangrovi]UKN01091.1 hypothetical protein K6119_15275 [Paracrocinitomix mangrovi]
MRKLYFTAIFLIAIYFVIGGIAVLMIQERIELLDEMTKTDIVNGSELPIKIQILTEDIAFELEKIKNFYPLYDKSGSTIFQIILLMSFGLLGALLRIVLMHIRKQIDFKTSSYIFTLPLLGVLTGLLAIVLSEILPDFELKSGNDKFFFAMSLMLGLYAKEVFTLIEQKLPGNLPDQVLEPENDVAQEDLNEDLPAQDDMQEGLAQEITQNE